MNALDLDELSTFARKSIDKLHQTRLVNIEKQVLDNELRNKDYNFFRTIKLLTPGDLINRCVEHHIYSTEKRMFDYWLKEFIIFICHQTYGGHKSDIPSVDLEFDREDHRFLVKLVSQSTPPSLVQISKWLTELHKAKNVFQMENVNKKNTTVLALPLADDEHNSREEMMTYSGGNFWHLLKVDDSLIDDIIMPMISLAKSKNDDYWCVYYRMLNRFYRIFTDHFLTPDYAIDWEKLVRFNSGREILKPG